ncbi:hypothetical protein OF83DRAFT_60228 [Amylostereum chailletii]|nr:hypothetical protein OF83DRAFT_60228 [Amylostereum chailletii]
MPSTSETKINATLLSDGTASPTEDPHARDDEFYIDVDQLSVFQVEGRLFKVHRHFLIENSTVFRDMFALPPSTSGVIEGDSDGHPIHLAGVTIDEFKSLMKVIYRSHRPNFVLSQAEWIAVLSISHRFEFKAIHERAVQILRTPPSEHEVAPLLVAAEQYGVGFADIIDALKIVVERKTPLSEYELQGMSTGLISRIMKARETFRLIPTSAFCARCSRVANSASHDAVSIVHSTWDIPIPAPKPDDSIYIS